MAAKRPLRRGPRGQRGKTGPAGPKGAQGPRGAPGNHGRDVARLSAQMDEIVKELQVQLTRIAQIQSQMDRIAAKAEQPWTGPERRRGRQKSETTN